MERDKLLELDLVKWSGCLDNCHLLGQALYFILIQNSPHLRRLVRYFAFYKAGNGKSEISYLSIITYLAGSGPRI